jgi:thiosulfate reductase cytochrome b subunit
MTIDQLTRRIGTALGLSGAFLVVAAFVCWVTGNGEDVVQSVHHVGAFVLAAFGLVFIASGLALSAGVRDVDHG